MAGRSKATRKDQRPNRVVSHDNSISLVSALYLLWCQPEDDLAKSALVSMTPLEKSLKRGMKRGTFLRSSLFFVSIWYSFRFTDVAMQASMLADMGLTREKLRIGQL